MSKRVAWIAATCGLLALPLTGPASGAPCAGFTDVDAGSTFCPNVEWLKNRAITLGCTSTSAYCPNNPVSREHMAAFMNRLGNALTPTLLRYDGVPGAIDLDASSVVCVTPVLAAALYPRHAFVDASLSALAPVDVGMGTTLVASIDSGPWTPLNATSNRLTVAGGTWAATGDIAAVDVDAGTTARFGLAVSRGGLPGTGAVSDSRCQLRALVYSRTGTGSPY